MVVFFLSLFVCLIVCLFVANAVWRAAIAERARLLAICDSVREWQDKELSEFDAAAAFAELDADEHVDSLGGNASAFGFASHRADQRSSMSQKVTSFFQSQYRNFFPHLRRLVAR